MKPFRSHCPLARTLDVFGDKWTLLVLREIIGFQRYTFKEIASMPENIATNILSDRLDKLVQMNLLTKRRSELNKLFFFYEPTEKSLSLMPVIQEIVKWSYAHLYKPGEERIEVALAPSDVANISVPA